MRSTKIVSGEAFIPSTFDDVGVALKDFRTAISETVEINLTLLDEMSLPKHLDVNEIREFLKKKINDNLEKDLLFEKAVELSRYAQNISEELKSYFGEIFKFIEDRRENLLSKIFTVSKMFLNSDLPLSFIKTTEDSILAEIDYFTIFEKRIRSEYHDLIRNRSNQPKFKRICEAHNSWNRVFAESRKKIEHQRVKLIWYVDLNNCRSVHEFFEEKPLKMNSLDEKVFSDYISSLRESVMCMEKLNFSAKELISAAPIEGNEAHRAFGKIAYLLSSLEETK